MGVLVTSVLAFSTAAPALAKLATGTAPCSSTCARPTLARFSRRHASTPPPPRTHPCMSGADTTPEATTPQPWSTARVSPRTNASKVPHRVEQLSSITDIDASEWDRLASAGEEEDYDYGDNSTADSNDILRNRTTSRTAVSALDTEEIHSIRSSTVSDSVDEGKYAKKKGGEGNPFVLHAWLRCLEESGCASVMTGWTPTHFVLRDGRTDAVLALVPAYIKTHSAGEFVFDQEWAEAAYGAGIAYYPKLLVGVPFTPASGRRVFTAPDISPARRRELLRIVADVLVRTCDVMGVSSVHVNFCARDEVEVLGGAGFLHRKGVQYHFTNYRKGEPAVLRTDTSSAKDGQGDAEDGRARPKVRVPYADFEDYLSEFKSKRRIKMRRERRAVREDGGIRIEVHHGSDITEAHLKAMFHLYKSTIDKMFYGRQYLTEGFFLELGRSGSFKQHLCLVFAVEEETGEIVGGTFNLIAGDAFYGRYWGCVKEVKYMHFETCYYAAIETCIDLGLSRMEPGAGGGDFKYMRGFEPAVTHSMHYVRDRRLAAAVARYLAAEGAHVDDAVGELRDRSAIRSKAPSRNVDGAE